jgi:hypothetical protein
MLIEVACSDIVLFAVLRERIRPWLAASLGDCGSLHPPLW